MIPYCKHAGIGLIPWSPLAGGKLARPLGVSSFRNDNNPHVGLFATNCDEAIVNKVEEVAKKLNVSMAQVATAWSLKKGVNPILGLQSEKRIDEAVAAALLTLSDEDVEELESKYTAQPVAKAW